MFFRGIPWIVLQIDLFMKQIHSKVHGPLSKSTLRTLHSFTLRKVMIRSNSCKGKVWFTLLSWDGTDCREALHRILLFFFRADGWTSISSGVPVYPKFFLHQAFGAELNGLRLEQEAQPLNPRRHQTKRTPSCRPQWNEHQGWSQLSTCQGSTACNRFSFVHYQQIKRIFFFHLTFGVFDLESCSNSVSRNFVDDQYQE